MPESTGTISTDPTVSIERAADALQSAKESVQMLDDAATITGKLVAELRHAESVLGYFCPDSERRMGRPPDLARLRQRIRDTLDLYRDNLLVSARTPPPSKSLKYYRSELERARRLINGESEDFGPAVRWCCNTTRITRNQFIRDGHRWEVKAARAVLITWVRDHTHFRLKDAQSGSGISVNQFRHAENCVDDQILVDKVHPHDSIAAAAEALARHLKEQSHDD